MTKRSKLKPTSVSTQIIIKPMVRTINDIGTWRSALRSADNGNRNRLYNLYEDLMVDGTLSDAIDKRIEAVKDADIAFKIDDDEPEEIKSVIDSIEFEDLIGEIMMSRFWGVTVDEFSFEQDGKFSFESISRKHIRPGIKEIAKNEEDEHGINYEDNPMILQFGKDNDLGILLRTAPYVIYKRGGFGDWAQFVELFGMPQRIGKYSSMDEASRKALIDAFETAGSAPYLVIPKETEATQTQLSSSGNGELYNDFRQACNEEILITILGQTMTTVDGSSLAQGKVHLTVQEKKHNADKRFVERTLNRLFVPMLEARGYKVHGGSFRFLKKGEETTVSEILQLSEIVDIPSTYIYDRYNIPKPREGEDIAKKCIVPMQVDVNPDDNDNDNDDDNGSNSDKSANQQVSGSKNQHIGFWKRFFVQAPAWCGATFKYPTNKADNEANRFIKKIIEAKGNAYFDADRFWRTSERLIKAVRSGYAQGKNDRIVNVDINYDATDEAFLTALEQNIYHFSASKTLAEVQQVNEIFRKSTSFSEFESEAAKIYDKYDRQWLETEYQTALLTAESASNYNRLMKVSQVYTQWEYKTVGDDNVREEHAELDGLILPCNDEYWDKIFPTNGWNCRCRVAGHIPDRNNPVDYDEQRQRVRTFYESKEWKTSVKHGFDSNRAKEEIVFEKNQMYIKDFLKKEPKLIDKISYDEWNVPTVDEATSKSNIAAPDFNGTYESWFKENAPDGVLRVVDYIGRTWSMNHAKFIRHTTGSHKNRVKFLNAIFDVMKNPDEVWLGSDNSDDVVKKALNNFKMIKFYKNNAICCVGKVQGQKLQLKSFYKIDDKRVRQGVLIHKE